MYFVAIPGASYFRGGNWKYSLETFLNLSQKIKQNIKQITPSHTNVAKNRNGFRQKPKYYDQIINCNDANLHDAPAATWVSCTIERWAGTWPAGAYQRRTNPTVPTDNFEGSPVLLGPRYPLVGIQASLQVLGPNRYSPESCVAAEQHKTHTPKQHGEEAGPSQLP